MPKATTTEVDQRVSKVFEMLSQGASHQVILQYASDTWKVRERNAYLYIDKARLKIKEIVDKQLATALETAISQLDHIINKCIYEGVVRYTDSGQEYLVYDMSNGRQALNDKMKLLGYNHKDIEERLSKIESTHPDIARMNVRELEKEYSSLH